jgi:gliding motility-associated-like protein
MRYFLTSLLIILICWCANSQVVYYQDVCKCGVTGAGFSTAMGSGSGSFDIYIEPGSTIKKAFLFGVHYGNGSGLKNPTPITINSEAFIFDSSNFSGIEFEAAGPTLEKLISLHALDVTEILEPSVNTYSITIPPQDIGCFPCRFNCFYLYVIYENPSFVNTTSAQVLLNNIDEAFIVDYSLDNFNPMSQNTPVGFALFTDRISGIGNDGSYLSFYNGTWDEVGLLKGPDNVNTFWGSGVKAHFYYQNETLFGLDDDTPDNVVNGPDGLINVENYIMNSSIDWRLQWEAFSTTGSFNIYNGFFLSHSTPCDTFTVSVPNDTIICAGETLQLSASGGQAYEWSASTPTALNDLSCTNCPNPIFSGDTSRFYTVRIWNNDSCSVVRPVKINVRPRPLFGEITTTPSECGASTCSVSVSVAAGTASPVSFTLNDTLSQSSGLFSNLAEGSYTLSFTDGNGCVSLDTVVAVSEVNSTVAQFTVSPGYGTVPLQVNLNNTSQNATDFLWSVNGTNIGAVLESYTCDPSGVYTIELIAWQYDPSCADTFLLSVTAVDRLIVPTAFTPDGDGVNDFWELPNIDVIYPENTVRIFNRWGNLLFESIQGNYAQNPWKGEFKNESLPVGSYYYIIETGDEEVGEIKGSVTVVR